MLLSRVEVYKDIHDQWRFRAVALNGKVVAVGEGYINRTDCIGEAVKLWPEATIKVQENADT